MDGGRCNGPGAAETAREFHHPSRPAAGGWAAWMLRMKSQPGGDFIFEPDREYQSDHGCLESGFDARCRRTPGLIVWAGVAERQPATGLNLTLRRRNMRDFVRCGDDGITRFQAWCRLTSSRVASATLQAASAKSSPEPAYKIARDEIIRPAPAAVRPAHRWPPTSPPERRCRKCTSGR